MSKILKFVFKIIRFLNIRISKYLHTSYSMLLLSCNGVEYGSLTSYGIPYISVSLNGKCNIQNGLLMLNGAKFSVTSDNRPCKIIVRNDGILEIGENLGMTGVTICAYKKIKIGNNVKIGGGSQVFDTNFHSLDSQIRSSKEDYLHAKNAPVIIEDDVFVGACCIIGKGVTIGKNSIIAAGSVVVKSIPENEIWGGNPAKFIKKLAD